jgi:cobalamin biosynthesis Co2+ chelatase CbiK
VIFETFGAKSPLIEKLKEEAVTVLQGDLLPLFLHVGQHVNSDIRNNHYD